MFFKLASNRAVHVSSSLLSRHHVQRSSGFERLSNATARGLGRPGAVTAPWLWDVCAAVVDGMPEVEGHGPDLGLLALSELRNDVVAAFGQVDDPAT